MINNNLLEKLRGMELQDVFDTLDVFWKEALNWDTTPKEEFFGENYDPDQEKHPCKKWKKGYIRCPECGGKTEVENVCSKSPFYKQGNRSMIMCLNDECTYYEYVKESVFELTSKLKEAVHG